MHQPFSNLLDFGPHFINSALFFLDDPEPLSVTAVADNDGEIPWHGMFVEKRMDATVYFKNDLRFNVTASPENTILSASMEIKDLLNSIWTKRMV